MKVMTKLFYITKHVHYLNNKIRINIQMACQTFPSNPLIGLMRSYSKKCWNGSTWAQPLNIQHQFPYRTNIQH
jgi:hypothetical protein